MLFGYWSNNWPPNGQFWSNQKFTDAVDHTPDLTHVKFQKISSKDEVSRPLKQQQRTEY